MKDWYKLDNAAKIFPAAQNDENTSIYRVSVILKEKVQENLLKRAANIVIQRYPIFNVELKSGTFWNYLAMKQDNIEVKQEVDFPCHPITDGSLLRVLYFNKKISVEIFHSLSDGFGAVEFLKTLIYQYLILKGIEINTEGKVLLPEDNIKASELEDSYSRYYDPALTKRPKSEITYQIKGNLMEPRGNNTIHGTVDAGKLNQIAKQQGATITAYLIAVLIYSIYLENNSVFKNRNNISIAVPVNLRGVFPSETLRNFFGVVNIGKVVNQNMSFNELLSEITHQLGEKTNKAYLQDNIAHNVRLEKNIWVKIVPLFIKKALMKRSFNNLSERKKTMTLSNIGRVNLPADMEEHIERMEVILYPTVKGPINCGVCTVNNRLTITFTRRIVEVDIISTFFKYLVDETGLDVKIESNEWGM